MIIRKATLNDIPALMELFAYAKQIMRDSGNTRQWGEGYPSPLILSSDIESGNSYVMCDEKGNIHATMAFIQGPDPTYAVIYNGEWPDDNPYYVIHRIAVSEPGRGLAKRLLDWAFEHTSTIRIDTHRDNVIMHHILGKYGFTRCGVILLANGSERDAYHLTISKE
ncbi:MAG: GNAT family N-acetyltransferase [Bacteroidaceae bacterium]|nr:GNAT family N-acetyltransferase [Bacteroidaceae bacterium]